jgi:hypothetical protein
VLGRPELPAEGRWHRGSRLALAGTGGKRMSWSWSRALWGVIAFMVTASAAAPPELVRVRHTEGIVHGFLVLRDQGGKAIARGDVTQNAQASRVTSRLTFHFFDGSLYDETAVFSQRSSFRLIRDRLRQNGPSFPTAVDMSIDVAAQRVTVAYSDGGKNRTANKRMELPADLANGLIPVLLKNVDRDAPPRALPMVVATPEPQLITLEITAAEPEAFSKDDQHQRVTEYTLKPHIGGVKGLLAPLVGKQPADAHVWILEGAAPAFLAAEQQFFPQGPLWRIELSVPAWRGLQR